jgi:hypothetical protein
MSWFFRYWEYRYRQDVEVESRDLIDETAAVPKRARVLTADRRPHAPRPQGSSPGRTVGFGDHLVRLRGRPVVAGAVPPPLIVELDGMEVAGVRFVRNAFLEATDAVRWPVA